VLKPVLIATSLAIALIAGALGETVANTQEYKSLDIAPNGTRLASVEPVAAGASEAEPRGPVIVRRVDNGLVLARIDPCHRCRYSGLAWSPDSTRLAFLATDERTGSVRVELATPMAGRAPASTKALLTLATIAGVASTPRWSPDGSQLALLMTVGAKKKAGALEAGAPLVGEIGSASAEQRIAVVARTGGELRQISPADTYVYEYDWTPDGRGFVVTAAKGNGDNNWWIAEIDAVDLATGRSRTITRPNFQISMPRATPDGKRVVFIGGLMSDFGTVGGEIYEVPVDGGTPISHTPGFRGSFMSLTWRRGNLFASALIVDRIALLRMDDAGAAPQTIWSTTQSASTGDDAAGDVDQIITLSADGERGATVTEDFGHGPTVIAGPMTAMRAITHANDALQVALDVKSVAWKSDGYEVQGWLVGPVDRAPGKHYPMIVEVHGGPSAASSPYFGRDNEPYTPAREWAARGYYVFQPNPRGSYGQGEIFTMANIRDFGGGDLRDVLAGVDTVLAGSPVDGDRLGIYGHSYGGFMTMWTVTHTQRFKAAIAGAGISNWISYYGENGIDQWMIPFFGASAYDEPAIYRAASPIESIKQARTPTLIYVGELDIECPPPQSFEFWHGLQAMGVPTQLIVYPGAGHWFYKPPQSADFRRREREWFDRYLAP
jgi:dipeptidyl aminopeptidase/acylaminoacyl peptidase